MVVFLEQGPRHGDAREVTVSSTGHLVDRPTEKRMIRQIRVVEGRLSELLPHQAELGAVRRGVAKRKAERLVFRGAVDEGKGIIGFLLVGRNLGFCTPSNPAGPAPR